MCLLIFGIFQKELRMKIRRVRYDEKYVDYMDIRSVIALTRDRLEPIRCHVI